MKMRHLRLIRGKLQHRADYGHIEATSVVFMSPDPLLEYNATLPVLEGTRLIEGTIEKLDSDVYIARTPLKFKRVTRHEAI